MITSVESKKLEVHLEAATEALIAIRDWKLSNLAFSETRLRLPKSLCEYDPDPSGKHEMTDQRRLDTAFDEFVVEKMKKIQAFLKD